MFQVQSTRQGKNINVVQVEAKTKPTSVFTSSDLDLKYIMFGKVNFKALVDTGADLCLLHRIIYLKTFI